MINVTVIKNSSGFIYDFTVKNHGSSYVCAGVSILTINTLNCIECFVKEPMNLDVDEEGAYIHCSFPMIKKGVKSHDANLLLNAMLFGLKNISLEHPNDISIEEVSE